MKPKSRSIISNHIQCIMCPKPNSNVEVHHIYNGNGLRGTSDKWGCWCYLCRSHHDMIHRNAHKRIELKKYCQKKFEERWGRDQFMKLFHKNYLWEEEDVSGNKRDRAKDHE